MFFLNDFGLFFKSDFFFFFFKCHFGTEETRDELRRQVYEAMADEGKGVQDKPVSEDGLGSGEVKENGVAKSPEKQMTGSVPEEQRNGAGAGGCAGREGDAEAVQQNSHKPDGQESMEEAEQDGDPAEGSTLVAKCTWVWSTVHHS